MPSSFWPLLLTSAAIGAVVSSVITIIGLVFERRHSRRELLLTKALELGGELTARTLRIAERTGRRARIQDTIVSAETYYHWLCHLFDHGKLPEDPRIGRFALTREEVELRETLKREWEAQEREGTPRDKSAEGAVGCSHPNVMPVPTFERPRRVHCLHCDAEFDLP